MYGALTGKSKQMIANEYGDAQLKKWRRGFKIRPPAVSSYSFNYPGNDYKRTKYVRDIPIWLRETINCSIEARKFQIHRSSQRQRVYGTTWVSSCCTFLKYRNYSRKQVHPLNTSTLIFPRPENKYTPRLGNEVTSFPCRFLCPRTHMYTHGSQRSLFGRFVEKMAGTCLLYLVTRYHKWKRVHTQK